MGVVGEGTVVHDWVLFSVGSVDSVLLVVWVVGAVGSGVVGGTIESTMVCVTIDSVVGVTVDSVAVVAVEAILVEAVSKVSVSLTVVESVTEVSCTVEGVGFLDAVLPVSAVVGRTVVITGVSIT